jgi:hypothetical protein
MSGFDLRQAQEVMAGRAIRSIRSSAGISSPAYRGLDAFHSRAWRSRRRNDARFIFGQ